MIRLRHNASQYVVEKVVSVSNTVLITSVAVISLVLVLTIIPVVIYVIVKQKRRIVIEPQLSMNSKNIDDVYDIVAESNHYQAYFPEDYADVAVYEPTQDGYVSIKKITPEPVDYLDMNKLSTDNVNKML